MRKITTLLMLLLLCTIGAKATVNDLSLTQWQTGATITNISTTATSHIQSGYYAVGLYVGQFLTHVSGAACAFDVTSKSNSNNYGISVLSSLDEAFGTVGGTASPSNRIDYVIKVQKLDNGKYTFQLSNGQYLPDFDETWYPSGLALSSTPGEYSIEQVGTYSYFKIKKGSIFISNNQGNEDGGNVYPSETNQPNWYFYPVTLESEGTGGGSTDPTPEPETVITDPYTFTVPVNNANGTFYRQKDKDNDGKDQAWSGSGSFWCYKFVSDGANNAPVVTVQTHGSDDKGRLNKFSASENEFSTGEVTQWDISVPDGYIIEGYKIVGRMKDASTGPATLTAEDDTQTTFSSWSGTYTNSTFEVHGVNLQSTYFTVTNNADQRFKPTTYEVYVQNRFDSQLPSGAVYTIQFTRESKYMGMYSAAADKDGNASTAKSEAKPTALAGESFDMNKLWAFERNEGTENLNLKHINSGLYLSNFANDTDDGKTAYITVNESKSAADKFIVIGKDGNTWAIKNVSTNWQKEGKGALRNNFNNGNNTSVIGAYYGNLGDPGNIVYIKKVSALPLSVSAAGWTAFCFPVKVTVPEGVTVYQATTNTDSYLHLEEVPAGTVLPAGQGFLCEAAEGTYDFAISAADAADLSGNLLSGATLKRTGMTANTYYGLGNKGGNVGFYKANMTTVPANKAFLLDSSLQASGAREMLSFQFGPATGIDMTENAAAIDTSVLYDLNGRRVFYPSRGIYVTADGKKVFLK